MSDNLRERVAEVIVLPERVFITCHKASAISFRLPLVDCHKNLSLHLDHIEICTMRSGLSSEPAYGEAIRLCQTLCTDSAKVCRPPRFIDEEFLPPVVAF